MLIRFGFSNHKSVRDYQEISFASSSLKDDQSDLFEFENLRESVLPAAVIYGANASGKSTMLNGLHFMTSSIVNSHVRGGPSTNVPRSPFALDEASKKEPSTFDADFVVEGVHYHFGFKTDGEQFVEEWLHAYPRGYKQIWYLRSGPKKIEFGKSLRGKLKSISELMRGNSLFISVAAQNNHEQLIKIYKWADSIQFVSKNSAIDERALRRELDAKNDSELTDFLRYADTGIVGFGVESIDLDDETKEMMSGIQSLFKKRFSALGIDDIDSSTRDTIDTVYLKHMSGNNKTYRLDIDDESDGTIRFLSILPAIFRSLRSGHLVVVDELDASLHTVLSERLIELFNGVESNPLGAQMLASTHDTNLLVGDVLRRDQIWFVEKDVTGASHTYPLTDIKTRNTDNLEKGYLEGRFGAIPMRASIRKFMRKLKSNA